MKDESQSHLGFNLLPDRDRVDLYGVGLVRDAHRSASWRTTQDCVVGAETQVVSGQKIKRPLHIPLRDGPCPSPER